MTDPPDALPRPLGWSFSAEQAANPELSGWRAPDGVSVVRYMRAHRVPGGGAMCVAAGDPFAPADRLSAVAEAFEQACESRGEGVIWFGASPRFHAAHRRTSLVIGAEPVLRPADWSETLSVKASLRAQVARARNKGVEVEEWSDARAAHLESLRPTLDAWLATRGMPQLHFLAQPDVLGAPGRRRFVVATQHGAIVAFAVIAPVGARSAALLEWIIRRPDAPNGTASLLVDVAMRACARDRIAEVSLGLVPLSTYAPLSANAPPPVVRALLRWTRAHARRFYHFDGLERFKAKFRPHRWEPSYLLTTQPTVTIGTLHAVADAFAGPISPERLVAEAVARAGLDEFQRLRDRVRALAAR